MRFKLLRQGWIQGGDRRLELRRRIYTWILFGLPQDTDWVESFATVELDNFRTALATLRRSSERSKCWQIRRDLKNYLSALEQQWFNSE